jgi:hypothetical protein
MSTKQINLRQKANAFTATIANGAALSDAVDIDAFGPRGIAVQTPTAWTAADIAFEVSADGTNYFPLYTDTGGRVRISGVATAEARVYIAPAEIWAAGAYTHLKIASVNTSTGADENQGAERILIVKVLS